MNECEDGFCSARRDRVFWRRRNGSGCGGGGCGGGHFVQAKKKIRFQNQPFLDYSKKAGFYAYLKLFVYNSISISGRSKGWYAFNFSLKKPSTDR
jgi:hypothetical protein